tara:strand:- start:1342 stop:1734 length:393 start_codon:yes stop_codon:yes gene_type:complete
MKIATSKKQLREFGLVIAIGFPIIIGWIIPVLTGHDFRLWTLWVGIMSFLISLINPLYLLYPYKLWMLLGNILGWFNTRIILGFVFIVVLQPIAFIMRLTGYQPLKMPNKLLKSYREIKENHQTDLNRIF